MHMQKIPDNLKDAINISSDHTRKHCHESALMTAAHILLSITQDGKSLQEIARADFDNNIELVAVWADYLAAVNWIHKNDNGADGKAKWIATDTGKIQLQKVSTHLHDDE